MSNETERIEKELPPEQVVRGRYEVIVVGAGHAGCEAALACARMGRKTLLLIGSVGCTLSLAGVGAIFLSASHGDLLVWLLVGFIASFSFSQGAVIWVYLSEVFPNRVRAKGQSLGSFTHWFMNALISGRFPWMAASSGAYPFVFFSLMMMLLFFVVLFVYPETKGISLEEMQRKLATG